jgi:SMODS and SLOG-associating 2TM effector domain 3/SMODS and SLOG-associating 2TM effector domain 1
VTDEHLPALYRVADRASMASQRLYLRLLRANLSVIVMAAVVGAWAPASAELLATLNIVVAAALLFGLIFTLVLLQVKPDKQWYGARAIAESVKTIAWRYMAGADPYAKALPDVQADDLLLRQLASVLHERAIGAGLGGAVAPAEQITPGMRAVRAQDVESRKATYLRDRIRAERTWYDDKARSNARASTGWLLAVGAAQLLAAVAAIVMVRWPRLPFDVASALGPMAAACMAWLQARRCQELAHAYGLAAQELGLVEARASHVTSEHDLAGFVAEAENAISREHTMWVARRTSIT